MFDDRVEKVDAFLSALRGLDDANDAFEVMVSAIRARRPDAMTSDIRIWQRCLMLARDADRLMRHRGLDDEARAHLQKRLAMIADAIDRED